jgi:hypothetical protein
VTALLAAFDADHRLGAAGGLLHYPDGSAQWSGGREPGLLWLAALASGLPSALARWPAFRRWKPVGARAGGRVDTITAPRSARRRARPKGASTPSSSGATSCDGPPRDMGSGGLGGRLSPFGSAGRRVSCRCACEMSSQGAPAVPPGGRRAMLSPAPWPACARSTRPQGRRSRPHPTEGRPHRK